jgi:hypothetical protein
MMRPRTPTLLWIPFVFSVGTISWALLVGGVLVLAAIQGGKLVPIPFGDLLDSTTGKIRVRYADIHSEAYRTLLAYMIRLKREDFEQPEHREALARAANLSEPEFVRRFGYVVEPR